MKRRQQEPKLVVQVSHLEDLRGFQEDGEGRLTVGAGETLTDVTQNPLVQSRYPVLAEAAGSVATPLIRNMGTLGGNICLDTRCNYYDQTYEWRKAINFCMKKDGEICWVAPGSSVCLAVNSSDTAPVMVALGAEIMLRSLRVQRVVPAGAFFRSDGITYLNKDPDELVTGVRLPSPNGWSATYVKLRRRGSIDFPVLGVAAWIMRDSPRGAVTEARVVLGAVASRPLEVPQAAQALIGRPLSEESIHDAAEAAFRPAKPMDNTDYALSWRKEMVRQFVGKALRRLM
jgi:4-hydroxybenzoyl-CoA reductase subunit beta